MGYTNGTGSEGTPTFNATPQTVADLTRLRDLIIKRGNSYKGTAALRTSIPAGELYTGMSYFETDTLREYTYLGATIGWFHSGGKVETAVVTYTGIYGAGTRAPRLVHNQGVCRLEGEVISSSATFVAATNYTVGSIPSAYAPSAARIFPVYLNVSLGFLTIDTAGNITVLPTVGFTGALSSVIDSANWSHKSLG
jgi:hypothetical protein